MSAKTWDEWYANIEDQMANGRIVIRTGNDQGRSQHRPLIEFERELVHNIAIEAWLAGVLAGKATPEARGALALERIADALDNGNELAMRAMEQRASTDPLMKSMAEEAQDSEKGFCPQTGEPCDQDCGVGMPCKAVGVGRTPS